MPELPETETLARDLHTAIVGAVITDVSVSKGDVLREASAEQFASQLQHGRITRVWRRAKLVVIDVASDVVSDVATASQPDNACPVQHIVVQPRFTGGLLIDDGHVATDELAYVAVSLHLNDGRMVHYRDVRRLGTVALMSPARFAEYSGAIGVEPLDPALGDTEFSVLVRSSRRPIKVVLMDQRRLAGVGNIYANEALWRSGIDPSRDADTLSPGETASLLESLRHVLTASIAARGTSFRDYRDARGERGAFVAQLAVYGRGGEPCVRCGRRLVSTHAVDGRGTVFCPTCQR